MVGVASLGAVPGLLAQVLLIGPWIYEVRVSAHGADALRSLFWNNVVGRFAQVAGPDTIDYTLGHKNEPGK